MTDVAQRIQSPNDLGRVRRNVDMALGVCAAIPIVAAVAAACVGPQDAAPWVRTLAVIWTASLLTFFAGVRRGLTFSEAGGGRMLELVTMLFMFAVGVLSLVLVSPAIGAAGLAAIGVLDAVSAARLETPRYFRIFRPLQMGVCVIAMVLIQLKAG